MSDARILSVDGRVAASAFMKEELVAKDELTLETEDIVLTSPARLYIKASVTTGNIKVMLAGNGKTGTDITLSYADVNDNNVHVLKVYKTGTDLTSAQFLLIP